MASDNSSARPLAPCRVLLVEDDPAVRAVFCEAAERSPLRPLVRAVTNGAEALRYLEGAGRFADRAQHPFPEVMVLDLAMPLMNGFDVLRALRAEDAPRAWRALPVVALTSVTDPEWKNTALLLGAAKYLEKGAEWEDWVKLVVEVVACAPAPPGPSGLDSTGLPPAPEAPGPDIPQ